MSELVNILFLEIHSSKGLHLKTEFLGANQRKTELIWLTYLRCCGSGANSGNPELIGDTGIAEPGPRGLLSQD